MSNIMNLDDLRNHVNRNGFDLSHRNCFTAKVGEILPIMCEEVIPGDNWKLKVTEFMRTAPCQTASFGRVRQYYDFYFVPYKLLWDKFPAYIMQTKNAYHAKDILNSVDNFSSHPYIVLGDYLELLTSMDGKSTVYTDNGNDGTANNKKLLSYLGYPLYAPNAGEDTNNLALNPFPLLGYQKIYQDYFRFSQWEDAAPWTYNLDYILSDGKLRLDIDSLNNALLYARPSMFTLRACSLDRDYFNGMLPSSQFGDVAVAGPLSGLIAGQLVNYLPAAGSSDNMRSVGYVAGSPSTVGELRFDNSTSIGATVSAVNRAQFSLEASAGNTAGLSILLLRQAECMQKWKEITLSGSPDYREQLYKHWGVKADPSSSQLCSYLGGIASDVDIDEVVNTNLDTDDSRAEIFGKGVSAKTGFIDFDQVKDYGLIYCIYHAKPLIEWSQNDLLPRLLTKTKATDYAIPEFDSIGLQSILRYEFIINSASHWREPVGYAPRYIEYKTSYDRINGEFQNSLAPWVIPHSLSGSVSGNPITYKDFKVKYNVLDNMFGVNADKNTSTDQFYCKAMFDVKVVRNLSRYGLPY